jgi:hypothetical protein
LLPETALARHRAIGGHASCPSIAQLCAQTFSLRARPPASALTAAVEARKRDPRLPAPGTVLQREHGSELHEITVLADRFEYRGAFFKTLSAIARQITGTAWNGFLWFGLTERKRQKEST